MLASLGKKDDGGNIEAILHEKQSQFKKRNLFILNEIISRDPVEKEEKVKKKQERDFKFIINTDDISSMSSVESDNELWESLEDKNYKAAFANVRASRAYTKDSDSISYVSEVKRKGTKQFKEADRFIEKEDPGSPDPATTANLQTIIDRYERKLDKMRENHKLEITTISNSLQNKAKEMIAAKIEEIKIKFESDMRALMAQYVEAKSTILEKDKQIQQLKELIRQQELSLSNFKRHMERAPSESNSRFSSLVSPDRESTSNFMKTQLDNMESEISSLKSLCNVYRRDEQNAQRQLRENIIKMNDMEARHKEEMEQTIASYEEKLKDMRAQLVKTQKEFLRYRNNTELEIKVLQALTNKYRETENIPPVEPNLSKKPSTALSRERNSKSAIRKLESRDSRKESSRRDSLTKVNNSDIMNRPDSTEETIKSLAAQTQVGRKSILKKLDSDTDGMSTFYSRDRSVLITPESTKYGSFVTRPGTAALDKSKASVSFTEQSEQL